MRLTISEIKSWTLSDDRSQIHLIVKSKYLGDREYSIPTDCLDSWIDALNSAKAALDDSSNKNPDQVQFEMPKNCVITANLRSRPLVLLVLDHKLKTQKGYAFTPQSAQNIAIGLTKNARETLIKQNTKDVPSSPDDRGE